MKKYILLALLFFLVSHVIGQQESGLNCPGSVRIQDVSDLTISSFYPATNPPFVDENALGNNLIIDGEIFYKGFCVDPYSALVFNLNGEYDIFGTWIGLDDSSCENAFVNFEIFADGVSLYKSVDVFKGDKIDVDLSVSGVNQLKLVVANKGGEQGADVCAGTYAVWGKPLLQACLIEFCDDGVDNDEDGLIDCNDPDCPECNVAPEAYFDANPKSGDAPLEVNLFYIDRSFDHNADDELSYFWDFGDGNTVDKGTDNSNFSHTFQNPGSYTITLTVSDGELTAQHTVTITVDAVVLVEDCSNNTDDDGDGLIDCDDPDCTCNTAPSASFTATPISGEMPLDVNFDASNSSDPENDPLSYSWDFGDGNTGSGVAISHTFQLAGSYQVTLTVSDGTETNQMSITITVTAASAEEDCLNGVDDDNDGQIDCADSDCPPCTENQPPFAAFVLNPTEGTAPLAVQAGAYASDPDDDPITLAWDFQEIQFGDVNAPSYSFQTPGQYTITLSVSDGEITTTASKVVTVHAAPTCDDGIFNGDETGLDCGGPDCPPCNTPEICDNGLDDDGDGLIDCLDDDCPACGEIGVVTEKDLCLNGAPGTGVIVVVNGEADMRYRLQGTANHSYQTSPRFENLKTGSYNLFTKIGYNGTEVPFSGNPINISCKSITNNDPEICAGACVTLGELPDPESFPYCVKWTDDQGNIYDDHNLHVCPDTTTTYTLYITDDNGNLLKQRSTTVDVASLQVTTTAPTACPDQPTTITATTNQSGYWYYSWSTGEESSGGSGSSIQVDTPGIYSVTLTDYSCSTAAQIEILACVDSAHCQVLEPDGQYACGTQDTTLLSPGQEFLEELRPGDSFFAGDFKVEVTEVIGRNGVFSGEGIVKVPYLNEAQVNVSIRQIRINEACQMVDGYVDVEGIGVDILGDELNNLLGDIIEGLETVADVLEKSEEILETIDRVIATVEPYLPDEIINELGAAKRNLRDAKKAYDEAIASGDEEEISKAEDALDLARQKLIEANQNYRQSLKELFLNFFKVFMKMIGDLVGNCVLSDLEGAYLQAETDFINELGLANDEKMLSTNYLFDEVIDPYEIAGEEELGEIQDSALDTIAENFYQIEREYMICLSLEKISNEILTENDVVEFNQILKGVLNVDLLDPIGKLLKENQNIDEVVEESEEIFLDFLNQILWKLNYGR